MLLLLPVLRVLRRLLPKLLEPVQRPLGPLLRTLALPLPDSLLVWVLLRALSRQRRWRQRWMRRACIII